MDIFGSIDRMNTLDEILFIAQTGMYMKLPPKKWILRTEGPLTKDPITDSIGGAREFDTEEELLAYCALTGIEPIKWD